MLSSAKDYYPEAAIIGGWVATNDFHAKRKDVLKKIVRAWAKANDELLANPEASLKLIHAKSYANIPFSDIEASWKAERCETSQDWAKLYQDGTVARWNRSSWKSVPSATGWTPRNSSTPASTWRS
jgi:NitT/TauT family transport system substrate-binding protein